MDTRPNRAMIAGLTVAVAALLVLTGATAFLAGSNIGQSTERDWAGIDEIDLYKTPGTIIPYPLELSELYPVTLARSLDTVHSSARGEASIIETVEGTLVMTPAGFSSPPYHVLLSPRFLCFFAGSYGERAVTISVRVTHPDGSSSGDRHTVGHASGSCLGQLRTIAPTYDGQPSFPRAYQIDYGDTLEVVTDRISGAITQGGSTDRYELGRGTQWLTLYRIDSLGIRSLGR